MNEDGGHTGEHVEDTAAEARRRLAERVRAQCIAAAEEAYEYAGLKGLCAEGRWAFALDTIRSIQLKEVDREAEDP